MKITDKLVLFFGNDDVCSNFYLCPLDFEGHTFHCSEHPTQWRGENRLGKCINKLISTLQQAWT